MGGDVGPLPTELPTAVAKEPGVILLTGCTGWLGSFVLAELLQQTSATIYCLVRASSPLEGKQRIESGLSQVGLAQLPLHRIVVFTGSLENMALGQRVASLMGWDLDEETEAPGTPVFAPHEHAPNTRPTAPWE